MFQKFGSTLPQSLIDAASGITEAKVEPAKPDAEAIARRKRLQALKDKQEDDAAETSYKKDTNVRKVAGQAYGGAKQKDDEVNEEVEELDEIFSDDEAKAQRDDTIARARQAKIKDNDRKYKNAQAAQKRRALDRARSAAKLSNEEVDIVEFVEALNEMDEYEIDEVINEVLGKDASAGDWIKDFTQSDNPKFKGKSKAQRKKMALAAYYGKQRNEELKGNQHKIDANKNGKVDAHDFKILRAKKKVSEDIEELDELSKGTLGSYVKKAAQSAAFGRAKSVDPIFSKSGQEKGKAQEKKRLTGISKAVDKMAKEEVEQIDELSKGTLDSYLGKSIANRDKHEDDIINTPMGSHDNTSKSIQKLNQRKAGIALAVKKMNKEDVDAYELVLDLRENKDDAPFDADKSPKKSAVTGKHGYGPSAARHLARMGLKKMMDKKKEKNETMMGKAATSEEVVDERIMTPGTGTSPDPLVARTGISRDLKKPAEKDRAVQNLKTAIKSTVKNKEHGKSKLPEETEIEESRGHKIIARKLADIDRMSSGIAPDYHTNPQSVSDKLKDKQNTDKVEIVTQKDTSASSQKPDMSHMDDKQELNKKRHGYGNVVHSEETEIDEATRIKDTQGGYNLEKGSKQSATDRKDAASVVKDFRARWRAKGRSTKRYDTNAQMDKETGFAATKEEVELDEASRDDIPARHRATIDAINKGHPQTTGQKILSKLTGGRVNARTQTDPKTGKKFHDVTLVKNKKGPNTRPIGKIGNVAFAKQEQVEIEEGDDKQYTHQVVHSKTGNVVGKYTSLKAASRAADKKDNAYGGVAHVVKPIGEEVELDETAALDQYIKSMGYDPEHTPKDKKVMFSKTNAFKTWASSRNRQEGKTPGQDDDNHMSPGATARG